MRGSTREEAILRLTGRNQEAAASVLEHWAGLRATQRVRRSNALRQLVAAARYRPPSQAPAVPLLVLSSRRDALVNPRCSKAPADRWKGDLVMHPSAGHDITLDDGPWVVDQVAEWLRRVR